MKCINFPNATYKYFMINWRDEARKKEKQNANRSQIKSIVYDFKTISHHQNIYSTALESFLCVLFYSFLFLVDLIAVFLSSFCNLNIWHAMCNAIQCVNMKWYMPKWMKSNDFLSLWYFTVIYPTSSHSWMCIYSLHNASENHKSTVPLLVFCWLLLH